MHDPKNEHHHRQPSQNYLPIYFACEIFNEKSSHLSFFIIHSRRCFLLLLLMAAILWKIKQKYDMFRRRQRLFVEMEQMASRPFSQVHEFL
jgi:hypothetical protein